MAKPRTSSSSRGKPPVSGAIDAGVQQIAYDEMGRVVGTTIRTVKNNHDPRWTRTRERAEACRLLLAGDIEAPMPKNFKLADADAFRADLPTTYTRALELLSMLQQKRCEIERFRTTGSQRSNDNATKLEQILTAVMAERYPWAETCDIVQNEALGCVITQPDFTYWESAPEYREADGTVRKRYQRNGDGKHPDEVSKNFRLSKKESAKAYESDKRDWYANNLPLVMRHFGPQEITPILGSQGRLDAIIVTTIYQRTSEIRRRFEWGEDDHMSRRGMTANSSLGTSSSGTGASTSSEIEVLEYFGTDIDGKVYVSYCVNGMATRYRDTGEPAVYDLSPYTSRLPVAFEWGQNWSGVSDADQRGVPFMWPFYHSALGANAIVTGATVALWAYGFPTYVTQPDPMAPPSVWGDTTRPKSIDIEPLKVIETPGPVTRLSGDGMSSEGFGLIQIMLGENEKAGPPEGASGGGDGSGFAKTVARRYAEDAQFQIMEGIRKLFETTTSLALEQLTNIAKERGPVPVYYAGPVVSPSEGDKTTNTRVLLELDADLAGDQWKVSAKYPPSMSLAERQQSAELVERRLKTRYAHFRDDGDPAPERTMAEIEAEDLVASDIGQEQRWLLVAKLLNDDQVAEKIKLMQAQRISQGGIPFALAEGFEDILQARAAAQAGGAAGGMPPTGPGGMPMGAPPQGQAPIGVPEGGNLTGFGGPSTAQASLAGAIGGQMSAQAVNQASAAGGVIPPGLGAEV